MSSARAQNLNFMADAAGGDSGGDGSAATALDSNSGVANRLDKRYDSAKTNAADNTVGSSSWALRPAGASCPESCPLPSPLPLSSGLVFCRLTTFGGFVSARLGFIFGSDVAANDDVANFASSCVITPIPIRVCLR